MLCSSFVKTLNVWLLSLVGCRAAASYFVYPPPGGPASDFSQDIIVTLGSTMKIQWVTAQTSYKIELWQQYADGRIGAQNLASVFGMYNSVVPYGIIWLQWLT
jgi:hypothetical protein